MLNPKYGPDFEDPVAYPGMKSDENECNFMKFAISTSNYHYDTNI